ncbi:MFS transporter [Umezawaea sp. Da 62-37]|uniref:MFS transporter n=1 Tax=Umezawaea sp. Da 62-37 TaxID=3075927 RepID=UPI0028F74625|nr:MFS transporter [Umezawaea sp. Da 62-37]WNV87404.1 MFS transporter [Umezawaea sp. Da 62-37]
MPDTTPLPDYDRRWWILSVLCLSALLMVVANMGLNVALPTIALDLDASTTSLAWIVDSYVLCFAGLLLPAGAIGDRFGRKATLQTGLLVFLTAAAAGAFSQQTWQLITARAVMGVGAALVTPGTLSLLSHVFPPAERAKAIGIWAAVAGGSVAVSLTWSGFMLEHFWWGSIFLGMSGVAALALLSGALVLPEVRHADRTRFDVVGAVVSVVGVTGLLYGLIEGPDDGWTSPTVLGGFALGALGIAAFRAIETRAENPMLDLRFFRVRAFTVGSFSVAAAYFALFGMYFLFAQYLQLVRGCTAWEAGLRALPAGLAQLVVAIAAKPAVVRYGIRSVLTGGLVAAAAGLLVLCTLRTDSSTWTVEAGLGLVGTGIGLIMPSATQAIMSSLPEHRAGVGSAVNNLVRELGGAFGIGLLSSITLLRYQDALTAAPIAVPAPAFDGLSQALAADSGTGSGDALADAARQAYTTGLDMAMVVGAAVALVCAFICWLILRTRTPSTPDPVTF